MLRSNHWSLLLSLLGLLYTTPKSTLSAPVELTLHQILSANSLPMSYNFHNLITVNTTNNNYKYVLLTYVDSFQNMCTRHHYTFVRGYCTAVQGNNITYMKSVGACAEKSMSSPCTVESKYVLAMCSPCHIQFFKTIQIKIFENRITTVVGLPSYCVYIITPRILSVNKLNT
jgi:hypothetical protein